MKYTVHIDLTQPLPAHANALLHGRELMLLDSNVLIALSYGAEEEWVRRILVEWRRYGAKAVCGICDFIHKEAINAENWMIGRVTVGSFLKKIAESRDGMYIEVSTTIKDVNADGRAEFLDLLPKQQRIRLIKSWDVSPTDKCLLVVAVYLGWNGVNASVRTRDRALVDLCKEFGIRTWPYLSA